jgi:hypothetical protein
VGSRIWDLEASWSLGPEGTSGSWDPIGVRGSGWALGYGTQKPLDLVALLQGLGLGTQISLQELPSALEVALVPITLRPAPCS